MFFFGLVSLKKVYRVIEYQVLIKGDGDQNRFLES